MDNPILSICIPTYNRAIYLEDAINSIVIQKRFQETNEVEIVISDNCSEDNTREVSEKYVKIYGAKIRYFRNSENIKDSNFEKVLSYGKGVFLKLNNDTLMHHEDTLDTIIEVISQNINNKDILFFSNGALKNITIFQCKGLSSFVKTVSFYSTWIGGFGIWREDLASIDNFRTVEKLKLVNDVLFNQIVLKKTALVINTKLFNSVTPEIKAGYDIITVFLENYIFILTQQLNRKNLSSEVYKLEKRKVLLNRVAYAITLCKIYPSKYTFTFDNMYKRIFFIYKKKPLIILHFVIYFNMLLLFKFLKYRLFKK